MKCALLVLLWAGAVAACGPGRGVGRRRGPRKLMPLVYGQHVPNVAENSVTASGLPEGRIRSSDKKFKDLVPNYNSEIIFLDDEGSGADRFMTQRCKEKLNTLSISVMNQWPGVRLRVTEGWDEGNQHMHKSLHYEGRAVDITTSDKDRSKYGMLARLAVEAGFDWVYYENRAHIHCSVKTESSAGTGGGCFPADTVVTTTKGDKDIQDLKPGDKVLTIDIDGQQEYSEIITFLDRDVNATRQFLEITAENNVALTATPSHLIMIRDSKGFIKSQFAAKINPGDILVSLNGEAKVLDVRLILRRGVFAPLTRAGTVLVAERGFKGAVASCYAVVASHTLAHAALAPLRMYYTWFPRTVPQGLHWYARTLYSTASFFLPRTYTYS